MAGHSLSSTPNSELRAIKWFTLTHALGLLLFVALMVTFLWYVQHLEEDQQMQGMYRDIEWAQQSLRLKLRENQEEMLSLAPDWASTVERGGNPATQVRDFLRRNPDVAYLAMLDARRVVRWVLPARGAATVVNRNAGEQIDDSPGYAAFTAAENEHRSFFTEPFLTDSNEVAVELYTPVIADKIFVGTIVVGYSLDRSLTASLPREVRERYQMSIVDQGGNLLVSSSPRWIHDTNLRYELPLDPPGHGVRLRAYAFETQPRLIDRTMLAAILGLSMAGIVSLAQLWRHARRRVAAEVERDRLFTLSLDLMAVLKRDGSFVRVNPAFETVLGPDAKHSLLGSLIHPDDRTRIQPILWALAIGKSSAAAVELEARFGHADQWRWLHWSIRGDPDPGSKSLYAVAHDTTERKLAETALAAETAFRRAMEDSILTGMRAFDMEGRITYVNRAFCQMLGLDEAELLGTAAPYPYWSPNQRAEQEATLGIILRGEAPASGLQVRLRRKDGSMFDARMYVSPLIDSSGKQTGWMTSVTDITEPTRIRSELAAAHERFTTVLDELDAAVSVCALPEGLGRAAQETVGQIDLLFANRFYRRMFGASSQGHDSLIDKRPTRDEWAPAEVYDPQVERWFEVRTRRIRWVDGRLVQMLVATDVTRRREAEDQHRQQADELQRTARLVTMGEMASSLAHELNQPLTAIANYCMGLSARVKNRIAAGQPLDGPEMLEMLGKTTAQAERAGKVIRRIREFVKRSEPERRACDLHAIVADAAGLAEIDAQRHSVVLKVDLPDNLPILDADPILIEQVLLNLMKNGIDAMRQSGVRELRVTAVRRAGHIEFSVSDTGEGMAAEVHDKLFEPFYTTKAEGMGMGLNICRSIVESHQGRLWVDSNATGGCTFRFTLPLTAGASIAQAA